MIRLRSEYDRYGQRMLRLSLSSMTQKRSAERRTVVGIYVSLPLWVLTVSIAFFFSRCFDRVRLGSCRLPSLRAQIRANSTIPVSIGLIREMRVPKVRSPENNIKYMITTIPGLLSYPYLLHADIE